MILTDNTYNNESNENDISFQQNQNIFGIYNLYRQVLSLILLVSFLIRPETSSLGAIDPNLFLQVVSFYVVFNALSFFRKFLPQKKSIVISQFVAIIIIDILVLALISYTCGGITSGMVHLIIIPVAASSIIFRGRISIFLAAIGTITSFYSEIYLYFTVNDNSDYFVRVALLGLILFTISILLQYLGGRIRKNELIAQEQAQSIESLEAMNYQIIQRMQTGIIVVGPTGNILNYNSSARKLLHDSSFSENILPSILATQLDEWRLTNNNPRTPFQPSNSSPKLQASFSHLKFEEGSNILIFLEDFSLLTSRAQHLKLMSLGRLTASIAHEIRNPLGAISHASQLLNESSHIHNDDRRLLEIIDNHSIRVNSIVDNVLQLSRYKSEVPELISLNLWLKQFIKKFSSSYKDPIQILLKMESTDITVRFNPSLLEQILTNLCENGLRYSLKKINLPHLTINVHTNHLNQAPILDVIDEGEGVPGDQIENIFEPFFTTESNGTGLGLFICEEICEANQAQLSYLLDGDNKSCFRIAFTHPDRNIL